MHYKRLKPAACSIVVICNVYLMSFYVGVLPGLPQRWVIEGLGTRLCSKWIV